MSSFWRSQQIFWTLTKKFCQFFSQFIISGQMESPSSDEAKNLYGFSVFFPKVKQLTARFLKTLFGKTALLHAIGTCCKKAAKTVTIVTLYNLQILFTHSRVQYSINSKMFRYAAVFFRILYCSQVFGAFHLSVSFF